MKWTFDYYRGYTTARNWGFYKQKSNHLNPSLIDLWVRALFSLWGAGMCKQLVHVPNPSEAKCSAHSSWAVSAAKNGSAKKAGIPLSPDPNLYPAARLLPSRH